MSESLSSTFTHSLEALPFSIWVIDSNGVILFVNRNWITYNREFGLSTCKEWAGANSYEFLREWVTDPVHRLATLEATQKIVQGSHLVSSTELTIHTLHKGDRVLRLEVFPLLTDYISESCKLIISIKDISHALEDHPTHLLRSPRDIPKPLHKLRLIPICASCKSIRNDKEEWLRTELFLQQKLSMQFTHDICPDCIRQLYPKYADALNGPVGK